MRRITRRSELGMVTAEAAVVLPLIAIFTLALIWMVVTVIAQVQIVDAARDGARALARGEDEQIAVGHARRTAPDGADVDVSRASDSVTVTVDLDAEPPRWLLVPLPSVHLQAHSSVTLEGDLE